jgi:hypothetical protein
MCICFPFIDEISTWAATRRVASPLQCDNLEGAGPMPEKGVGIWRLFSDVYEARECTLGRAVAIESGKFFWLSGDKDHRTSRIMLACPTMVNQLPDSLHRGNEVTRQVNDRYDQTNDQGPHGRLLFLQQFALAHGQPNLP